MHNNQVPQPGDPRNIFKIFRKDIRKPTMPDMSSRILQNFVDKQAQSNRRQNIEQLMKSISGQKADFWIFCMRNPDLRVDQYAKRVSDLYKLVKDPNFEPQSRENEANPQINFDFILQRASQIEQFLKFPGFNYKIVVDANSGQEVISAYKDDPRVSEFYICRNNNGSQSQAYKLKSMSTKVKQILNSINDIFDIAGQQMQEAQLKSKVKKSNKKVTKTLPNFIALNKKMSHLTTQNYINAISALVINEKQKEQCWDIFKQAANKFIQVAYDKHQQGQQKKQLKKFIDEMENKKQYVGNKRKKILKMYSDQNFFHKMVNNSQRTMKSIKEFEVCKFAFKQIFQSILLHYQGSQQITVFRGAKMEKRQLKNLKQSINSYIMLLGFASFSTSKQTAGKFAGYHGQKGIIIRMKVKKRDLSDSFKKRDYGFVRLSGNNIGQQFSQLQILFNALNVYKVTGISQQKIGNDFFTIIDIQYGAMFDLLRLYEQDPKKVNKQQLQALINYQFCVSRAQKIQDKSDAWLQSNEFKEAQTYKQQKRKEESDNFQVRMDLANIYCNQSRNLNQSLQCLQQAEQILHQKIKDNIKSQEKQIALNLIQLQQRKIQILQQKGIYTQKQEINQRAQEIIQGQSGNKALIKNASLYCQKGKINMKIGMTQQVNKKLDDARNSLLKIFSKQNQNKQQSKDSSFNSVGRFFCCGVGKKPDQNGQNQPKQQTINSIRHQISEFCVDYFMAVKQATQYQQNVQKAEQQVQFGRQLIDKIRQSVIVDSQVATDLKVSQAIIESSQHIDKSRQLLAEALQIDRSRNQYRNLSPSSSKILIIQAKINMEELSRSNNWDQTNNSRQSLAGKFSKQRQQKIYQQTLESLSLAVSLVMSTKSIHSIQIQRMKKMLVQLHFGQRKIVDCLRQIRQMKAVEQWKNHIGMAAIYVIKAKVHFERGDLTRTKKNLKKACELMGIIQQQNNKEAINFENLQFEIYLLYGRIYKRQQNLDMTRNYLKCAHKVLQRQNLNINSHCNYAILYQEYASIQTINELSSYSGDFYSHFERSIQILQQMRNKQNIPLAICHVKYAGLLLLKNNLQDLKKASESLQTALEIFSKFPRMDELPSVWLLYYTIARQLEIKKDARINNQKSEDREWYLRALKCANNTLDPTSLVLLNLRINIGYSILQSLLRQSEIKYFKQHIKILEQMKYAFCLQFQQLQRRLQEQEKNEENIYSYIENQEDVLYDVKYNSKGKNDYAVSQFKQIKCIIDAKQSQNNRLSHNQANQNLNGSASYIRSQVLE